MLRFRLPLAAISRRFRSTRRPIVRRKSIEEIVRPQPVRSPLAALSPSTVVANFEQKSKLRKDVISSILDRFCRKQIVRELAESNGLNDKLFMSCFNSFRTMAFDINNLSPELLVLFTDIHEHEHSEDVLFPQFLSHARKMYPHLECLEDLRVISDLTLPHNWYPEARSIHRKIIFHAGPTNSGKTYNALKRFMEAETGIYCGPLRLLAYEVFHRTNKMGVPCDMVTGDDRQYAVNNQEPADHLSSTVEMLSLSHRTKVAVIDEIQMLRDEQRGWAWTRALLGAAAEEVHLCGEAAAIEICRSLLDPIGEHVEVHNYERKSPIQISTHSLGDLSNVDDGDCIVCFNKAVLMKVAQSLEKRGISTAIVYGSLPPATKLAQAARFNDPDDPTKVLVATDAIGMGLNLNIKRVIFHSLIRMNQLIPNYQALQIAGRAGRYGTSHAEGGYVTTYRKEDLGVLKDLLSEEIVEIGSVGIAPTYEQIEMFSNHLPNATLTDILDIFISICTISDQFFLCSVEQTRAFAIMLKNIDLPLQVRYTFCNVPISADNPRLATFFVRMARRFSIGEPLTEDWFAGMMSFPPTPPKNPSEIPALESMFDIITGYLWLHQRYETMFPDAHTVRKMGVVVTDMINDAVERLVSNNRNRRRKFNEEATALLGGVDLNDNPDDSNRTQ